MESSQDEKRGLGPVVLTSLLTQPDLDCCFDEIFVETEHLALEEPPTLGTRTRQGAIFTREDQWTEDNLYSLLIIDSLARDNTRVNIILQIELARLAMC